MQKAILKTAIATAMGIATVSASSIVSAGVIYMDWTGYLVTLFADGGALANTSISSKGNNQFLTPISGTMQFDDLYGAGTVTLSSFYFLSNGPQDQFQVSDFQLQAIGDGMGGAGVLVLGNMLFNWSGTSGIPVSLVLDAAGFLSGDMNSGGANSAVPASDGTFTNASYGYLAQGAMPIVTTAWNAITVWV